MDKKIIILYLCEIKYSNLLYIDLKIKLINYINNYLYTPNF